MDALELEAGVAVARFPAAHAARDQRVSVAPEPLLGVGAGHVQRAKAVPLKRGSLRPWQGDQNHLQDMPTIRSGRIADGVIRLGPKGNLP